MSSPRGIENQKRKNAQKVQIKCKSCGEIKEITFGYYRNLKDINNWECYKCSRKNWYKNMSDEAREKFLEAHKNVYNNMTEKEREERSRKLKSIYQNFTDEQKRTFSEKSRNTMRNYWGNISDEKYSRRCSNNAKNLKNFWSSLSEEGRKQINGRMSKSQRERWENMTEEERLHKIEVSRKKMQDWWDNSPKEKIDAMKKKVSTSVKLWWENITPEEYQRWDQARAKGHADYYKYQSMKIPPTEQEFMNYLNRYGLSYNMRWYNKQKHPDFDKIFTVNPITKYPHVSPYREWDFKVNTKSKSILIDVDGSMHDPKKTASYATYPGTHVRFKVSDFIKFNDSKRPYQTDGLDAYVIKCYNDKLNEDSIAENVVTNESMKFSELMAILSFLDMDDDEINEFMKFACND